MAHNQDLGCCHHSLGAGKHTVDAPQSSHCKEGCCIQCKEAGHKTCPCLVVHNSKAAGNLPRSLDRTSRQKYWAYCNTNLRHLDHSCHRLQPIPPPLYNLHSQASLMGHTWPLKLSLQQLTCPENASDWHQHQPPPLPKG